MSREGSFKHGDIVVIRPGWEGAGTELYVLGGLVFHGQWWIPVVDPEDGDPTFFKAACVEFKLPAPGGKT